MVLESLAKLVWTLYQGGTCHPFSSGISIPIGISLDGVRSGLVGNRPRMHSRATEWSWLKFQPTAASQFAFEHLDIKTGEKGKQSTQAALSFDEAIPSTLLNTPETVANASAWNQRTHELFPNQPSLRIDQVDFLDQNANPLLADFWNALRASLDADEEGGAEELNRVDAASGELCSMENFDVREQWYLSSEGDEHRMQNTDLVDDLQSPPDKTVEDNDPESGAFEPLLTSNMEMHAGLPSFEIPQLRVEHLDPELKIPAPLLSAYKTELLRFILRERAELKTILKREKQDTVQVKWEHRVLRRSLDGELAAQPNIRFHRDKVPDDLENTGVLCVFTVITVLENFDPRVKGNPQGNSLEHAGTVFKLDKLFGSTNRSDPHQILQQDPPEQNDGFLYWYSRSLPGTATIFNNCDDESCWTCADNGNVTIEYSLTPQMAHSVAEVEKRWVHGRASERSRTILQTKITFCSSLVARRADDLMERLKLVGLEPHLVDLQLSHELRYDDGGPYSFAQFVEEYEDEGMDYVIAHWNACGPSVIFPLAERGRIHRRYLSSLRGSADPRLVRSRQHRDLDGTILGKTQHRLETNR